MRTARHALRRSLVLLIAALAPLACGGDDGPAGPGGGNGGGDSPFRATIDGQAWAADASSVTVTLGSTGVPGSLIVTGTRVTSGSEFRAISLLLGFIEGTGTYPLGVNFATNGGGSATVTIGGGGATSSFMTPLDGAAGSMTVTSLTGARIAGTFAFEADPTVGATTSVSVTSGSFDVPLPSGFAPASGNARGSRVSASFGGAAWNAATIIGLGENNTLGITATNTTHVLTLNPLVPVASGGTYTVGENVNLRVHLAGQQTAWGGQGSTGTVTLTTYGARAVGTFSGVLTPIGGGGGSNLSVTDGTFDVRLGG